MGTLLGPMIIYFDFKKVPNISILIEFLLVLALQGLYVLHQTNSWDKLITHCESALPSICVSCFISIGQNQEIVVNLSHYRLWIKHYTVFTLCNGNFETLLYTFEYFEQVKQLCVF